MPRKSDKPLTPEEIFKLQEQQEQELTYLQRQYAFLEKDRVLYSSGAKLNRLRKIVSIFKKEHFNIEADLEVATAPFKRRQDAKAANLLSHLLEDHKCFDDTIKEERRYLVEIDDQIKVVEKDVVKLRSMQVTDRQHEERVWKAIKTIETLMNQLDVQNKKFGTLCAENSKMKHEIKKRLWEREEFMKTWDKLINKLVVGKKFMMDLIEQATIAYDQREEWCSKLQALRVKAHNDFFTHTQQMRELKRKQDDHKKLEEFCNIRCQRRVMKDLREKERLKTMDLQVKLKDRLSIYSQHLNDILEFTKESKIENIAMKYYRQEAENFALFKHINNLLLELERLSDDLQHYQDEITASQQQEALREEKRLDTLINLEKKLEEANKRLNEEQEEIRKIDENINFMLSGIKTLVSICKCNTDPIMQLLGDNKHITIYNYRLYVNLVENMVHKAMLDVFYREKHKKVSANQRVIWDDSTPGIIEELEKLVPTNPCPLCVQRDMVNDVVDHLQQVMNKDQVKAALLERMNNPEQPDVTHNVSKCFLPESRDIIQKRYQ